MQCRSLLTVLIFCALGIYGVPPKEIARFSCEGRTSGYYADVESGCQVYHMCDGLGRQFSYHCPNTTLFQQRMLICDHWYMVNCSKSEKDYSANLLIGQRDKPFVDDSSEHPYHRTPRPDLLKHPNGPDYLEESLRQGRSQIKPLTNLVGVASETNYSTDRPVYFVPSHWSTQYSKDGTTPLPRSFAPQPTKKFNFLPFGKNPILGEKPSNNYQNEPKKYKIQISKVVNSDGQVKSKQNKVVSSTPRGTFITAASGPGLQGFNPLKINSQLDKPASIQNVPSDDRTEYTSTLAVQPTFTPTAFRTVTSGVTYTQTDQTKEPTNFGSGFSSQGDSTKDVDGVTESLPRTTGDFFNGGINRRVDFGNPDVEPISIDLLPPKLEPLFNIEAEDRFGTVNKTKIEPPSRYYQPPKYNFTINLATSTMDPREFYRLLPSKTLEPPKEKHGASLKATTTTRTVTKKEISNFTRAFPSEETIPSDGSWKELRQRFFIPEYDFPLEQVARPGYESGVSSFQVNPAPLGPIPGDRPPGGGIPNPDCPKCDPAFLISGTCKPCVLIRR